jgi:hypothetical protein
MHRVPVTLVEAQSMLADLKDMAGPRVKIGSTTGLELLPDVHRQLLHSRGGDAWTGVFTFDSCWLYNTVLSSEMNKY